MPDGSPWPSPANMDDDEEGWAYAGKGTDSSERLRGIGYTVVFTLDQSDWLQAQAERQGITVIDLIRQMVDQARGASTP
jgi:hypothetical protein